ncbi:MAG: hypothetical protein SFY32_04030 [Bacteroidota bacterium]|nr:hypothetical protein [Bacteroidota bacterium]
MENLLNKIKKEAPFAFKEFKDFIDKGYHSYFEFHKISLDTLNLDFGIGIFIRFFNENAIDFTIDCSDISNLESEIIDAFKGHENVIGHYS